MKNYLKLLSAILSALLLLPALPVFAAEETSVPKAPADPAQVPFVIYDADYMNTHMRNTPITADYTRKLRAYPPHICV